MQGHPKVLLTVSSGRCSKGAGSFPSSALPSTHGWGGGTVPPPAGRAQHQHMSDGALGSQ